MGKLNPTTYIQSDRRLMIVWNLEVANLGAKRDSQGAQSLQSAIDVRPGHRQQFGSLLVFVLSHFGIHHCVFVQFQPAIDWVSLICWVVALSVVCLEFLSRLTDLFFYRSPICCFWRAEWKRRWWGVEIWFAVSLIGLFVGLISRAAICPHCKLC